MKKEHWVRYGICTVGFIIHIVFWLSLNKIATSYTSKVWTAIALDPSLTPNYEAWEVDWNYTLMAIATLPFIYLPTTVASVIAALLPISRGKRLSIAFLTFGVGLGLGSLLYTVLLIASRF